MDHTPRLGRHSICRCGNPACAGENKGKRTPEQMAYALQSGTFRISLERHMARAARMRRPPEWLAEAQWLLREAWKIRRHEMLAAGAQEAAA